MLRNLRRQFYVHEKTSKNKNIKNLMNSIDDRGTFSLHDRRKYSSYETIFCVVELVCQRNENFGSLHY